MNPVLEAFYKSGRPVDVIDPDGWHMAMWNTGSGLVCIGMWREGEPIRITGWKSNLDRFVNTCKPTSTVKFIQDILTNPDLVGWRIESLVVSGYSR